MEQAAENVRYHIINFCLENCHPPSDIDLSRLTNQPLKNINTFLKILEKEKHVLLYDETVSSTTRIAMAHPFAHLVCNMDFTAEQQSQSIHCGNWRSSYDAAELPWSSQGECGQDLGAA
ncbi:hypothetical protein BJ170DRAFT_730021 [Xylariales sp. AK1849]|nr:hypothetical protein BJ170DRAFT_730021 [Xylariales sp. AK1849]